MGNPKFVIGIDEVGRGPLAGPLTAAAVMLKPGARLPGLNDSKLLNRQQRVDISRQIRLKALAIGIGWASCEDVDRLGLTEATTRAMARALEMLNKTNSSEIIIDGKYNYLAAVANCRAVVKADQQYAPVMAASIIAKVARDNYMAAMGRIYPGYGFERHVGYGTAEHRLRIIANGPSPLHRLSFKPLAA